MVASNALLTESDDSVLQRQEEEKEGEKEKDRDRERESECEEKGKAEEEEEEEYLLSREALQRGQAGARQAMQVEWPHGSVTGRKRSRRHAGQVRCVGAMTERGGERGSEYEYQD